MLGGSGNDATVNIPPKIGFELVVFLALATSAGFAEELVLRGYLTHSLVLGPEATKLRSFCKPSPLGSRTDSMESSCSR